MESASRFTPPPRLVVPYLGMPDGLLTLSLWLVPEGAPVAEGDRVAELACGGVTFDLEAPVSGRIVRHFVDEDAAVAPGDVIAEFDPVAPAPGQR
jgi:pyruvate/2-oxoglutarate dehydrogenase complex dihydrolipoamide acyltransferase (E2) component